MKRLLIAVLLLGAAGAAWAGCRYWTYTGPDGRTIFCTTCCYPGGACDTTCN